MKLSKLYLNRRDVLRGLAVGTGMAMVPPAFAAGSHKKVALLMMGSLADGGWNELAYAGLTSLEKQGLDIAYVENLTQAQVIETIRGYADDGNDLIIGHGYEFGAAVAEIAPEYPQTAFYATTYIVGKTVPENSLYADLAYVAASYAAGSLAGLISEKGQKVGFVGGGDNPTQQAMARAFIGGAEEARPGLEALSIITGDYNNAAKGKEAALTMTGNGADVIWHAANVTGLGAIEGASSVGAKVIGCYSNQTAMAPDSIASSLKMNLDWMVTTLGKSIKDGSFKGGFEWQPTVEEMWSPIYGEGENATEVNSALVSDAAYATFSDVMKKLSAKEIDVVRFLSA